MRNEIERVKFVVFACTNMADKVDSEKSDFYQTLSRDCICKSAHCMWSRWHFSAQPAAHHCS